MAEEQDRGQGQEQDIELKRVDTLPCIYELDDLGGATGYTMRFCSVGCRGRVPEAAFDRETQGLSYLAGDEPVWMIPEAEQCTTCGKPLTLGDKHPTTKAGIVTWERALQIERAPIYEAPAWQGTRVLCYQCGGDAGTPGDPQVYRFPLEGAKEAVVAWCPGCVLDLARPAIESFIDAKEAYIERDMKADVVEECAAHNNSGDLYDALMEAAAALRGVAPDVGR